MVQHVEQNSHKAGLHVAIIMDGNGRWATARGRSRSIGHRVGARTVRRIVESAPGLGISTLTLFAFSSDNWQRPTREVTALMRLFGLYLRSEMNTFVANQIRLSVIGRRDRLSPELSRAIEEAEQATIGYRALHLRVAVDYSARAEIVRAAGRLSHLGQVAPDLDVFARLIGSSACDDAPAPDVDLLIRTGGEQRLSDFLLWECAYAELVFTPQMWPDFTPADLATAVEEFHHRERRFGRVPAAVAAH